MATKIFIPRVKIAIQCYFRSHLLAIRKSGVSLWPVALTAEDEDRATTKQCLVTDVYVMYIINIV